MERGIGWVLPRWTVALAAALLVMTLVLASYHFAVVGSEQTVSSPREKTKRESLRYGGKSFEQWRVELETELKPEFREEGLTAMAAFGANGYGSEAARVIVELMKGYHPNTDFDKDKRIVVEAYEAIGKIDKPAYPVLWESLRGKNERTRQFAFGCFQRFGAENWHPPVVDLLKGIKETEPQTREIALRLLQNVNDKPMSCIPLLIECLKDEEHEEIRVEAMRNLGWIGPDAKDALPQLRRLRDNRPKSGSFPVVSSSERRYQDLVLETMQKIEGK